MNIVEQIEVVKFSTELANYFSELNKEWILKYFEMEQRDEYVLSNPEEAILQFGGQLFFAKQGDRVVGTCALVVVDENTYEVSKMAVTAEFQGRGVGNALMTNVVRYAKARRMKKLVLYTNSTLKAAIAMYKKFGFKEVPKIDFHSKRSDTKMSLKLR